MSLTIDAPGKTLTLLNRSAPPSATLADFARVKGLNLVHLPLVLPQISVQLSEALQAHALGSDWLIFCSPRAVAYAEQHVPGIWQRQAQFGAVGAGTAYHIQQKTPRPVVFPTIADGGAALLRCAELQNVRGRRVSVFTGADGLHELESTLAARGAQVQSLVLYERVRRKLTPEQSQLCKNADNAYVGSVSFFDALLEARGGFPLPVWVPSPRVAAHALSQGCTPDLCANSSDEAFITRLKHYKC